MRRTLGFGPLALGLALLLAACGRGAPPPDLSLAMDWTPLLAAASAVGGDGPITLTGTLQGSPHAPLRLQLQLSYRPKEGDWGPWEDRATFTVEGDQVRATLPAPGLDLPVGLDELGKAVRARVVMGEQVLSQMPGTTLGRVRPVWSRGLGQGYIEELFAQGGLVCGYYYPNNTPTVVCLDPETGRELWRYPAPTDLIPLDIFVAGDGMVYVGGRNRPEERGVVSVLREGALVAQYPLGEFYGVAALAVEGDTLYAGGPRRATISCQDGNHSILRVRFAKYGLSGGTPTLVALHDPTPQDLGEIASPSGCDEYRIYNYSSTPALRVKDGKVYAPFAIGAYAYWSSFEWVIVGGCLGWLRLDAATFTRDWLLRPERQGADGGPSWSTACNYPSGWSGEGWGWYRYFRPGNTEEKGPSYWHAPDSLDLNASLLHVSESDPSVDQATGRPEPGSPGGRALAFLDAPGMSVVWVRYGGVTVNPYGRREGLFVKPPSRVSYAVEGVGITRVRLHRDPQGRVYVYGGDGDGQALVARLR